MAKESLGTFKLTTGARKAWRALAPPVHLVALGSVVAEALVDAIRTKPSRGTRLGAVVAHQAARAAAGASDVMAVCVVPAPALLAATFPVEAFLAGARAVWTSEAGRADATSRKRVARAVGERAATGRAGLLALVSEESQGTADLTRGSNSSPATLALAGQLVAGALITETLL